MQRTNAMKLCEPPASALARWQPEIHALADDKATAINVYSTVGEYGDGTGMTAKIVSSILRKADGDDVVVNINSPGGDFFEGLAINTLLREYKGNVKVNVVGLAASAASLVALGGDEVSIAKAGFFMIHKAWTMAIGNSNDMEQVAEMLSQFDDSASELYARATGIDAKRVRAMMEQETWLNGDESVKLGFAHALLDDAQTKVDDDESEPAKVAQRKLDSALARAGMPRSERRKLLKEITEGTPRAASDDGTPRATETTTPCAGDNLCAALSQLHSTINATIKEFNHE